MSAAAEPTPGQQPARPPALLGVPLGVGFLLPALALVTLFLLVPFAWIVAVSFTNQSLLGGQAQFVGLVNYARMFDQATWLPGGMGYSLVITGVFVLGSLVGQVGLGLLLALLFFRRRGVWREVVFTLVTLCWILPDVPIAFGWLSFLDRDFGLLNAVLGALHLGRPDWTLDHPLTAIILFNIWRGTAFSMLLFSAALEGIPPSYLEVASVSGARFTQQLRDIILPSIQAQLLSALVLITIWTFNTFGPFLITGGGPLNKTDIVAIHTYRVAFKFGDWGLGTSIAMVVMLLNLVLTGAYLLASRRGARDARA